MLMTARQRAASTYLMARRQLLTPYLMSSVAGTWAHVSSASYLLGGALQSSTHADDDEIALLANHPIAQGAHDYRLLHNTFTTNPIFALDVNGAEEASVDQYGGSAANVVSEDSFTLGAKSAALSLRISGKNASSTDYYASAQLGEVVKTSDGNDWGSGPEDLPWYQDIPPWFSSAATGPGTWSGNTLSPFGGTIRIADADAEYTEYLIFCPATADYQMKVLYNKLASGAIMDATVDGGSSLGTTDTYNGSTTYGNTATISLGTLSAGWHTLRLFANGRNGSNTTGYNLDVAWLQLQRTTTGTCPAGVNGPEQILLLPQFSDAESGTWTLTISASHVLYGYTYAASAPLGSHKEWSCNMRSGSWQLRHFGVKDGNGDPAALLKINGSTEDTLDFSNGGLAWNLETSGTFTIATSGKNTIRLETGTNTKPTYLGPILLERTGD